MFCSVKTTSTAAHTFISVCFSSICLFPSSSSSIHPQPPPENKYSYAYLVLCFNAKILIKITTYFTANRFVFQSLQKIYFPVKRSQAQAVSQHCPSTNFMLLVNIRILYPENLLAQKFVCSYFSRIFPFLCNHSKLYDFGL